MNLRWLLSKYRRVSSDLGDLLSPTDRTSCSGVQACYLPLVLRFFSQGFELVALTLPWPGMAHEKQRRVLNSVFSVQHMRMVMPILWDVTRRVRPTRQHPDRD
jgi:hypothetical protein